MSRASRGGLTLKTGKIGRVNCLRQQLMMPGERMNINVSGKVRLEALRERDVMRINAHLACFMTPLRWLQTDFPDFVKEGPDTLKTITQNSSSDWSTIGIGAHTTPAVDNYNKFFEDAYLRCYNEWYKWPEDSDAVSPVDEHGNKAVPLSTLWSRARYDSTPDDTDDYQIDVSGATMDVRDLAEVQGRFRAAMKRDVFSFNRWMELVRETWKGDGSREVDQVPVMLDQVEVGVNPREMPATDAAGLGEWQSLFDFGVNHSIRGVVAPEHCVLTWLLTVRFAPVIESAHPLATTLDWWEMTADPEYIASKKPVPVQLRDFQQNNDATQIGYLPAGWQWRCEHNVIGKSVDIRDSFPYMLVPSTQAEAKDATRVKNAFRSQALDDYLVDVYFKEDSIQPIGDAMESYMSGMVDDAAVGPGGRGDEFPKGGKQL